MCVCVYKPYIYVYFYLSICRPSYESPKRGSWPTTTGQSHVPSQIFAFSMRLKSGSYYASIHPSIDLVIYSSIQSFHTLRNLNRRCFLSSSSKTSTSLFLPSNICFDQYRTPHRLSSLVYIVCMLYFCYYCCCCFCFGKEDEIHRTYKYTL